MAVLRLLLIQNSLTYAHVVRLTTSPLPISGKDGEQAATLALRTLRDLLPFIFDRTSKHAYLDLESVFFDLWSRILDVSFFNQDQKKNYERVAHHWYQLRTIRTVRHIPLIFFPHQGM